MKRVALVIVIVLAVLVLASCAPGPNSAAGTGGGEVAGFWKGVWHGAIALVTFVISLFNDNVNIYEVNNNGGWYNFGFILGIMIFWGGGSGEAEHERVAAEHGPAAPRAREVAHICARHPLGGGIGDAVQAEE